MCPSIENVIVWRSENVLGRTVVEDIRMASSSSGYNDIQRVARPVRGSSHVLDESCRCENVRHPIYPRRQWVVEMKVEIT